MSAINPRDRVLEVLQRHQGTHNGIRGADIAQIADVPERRVRTLVSELREDGFAICAHPESGYFIAETGAELEGCCQFLRSRAMHSLTLEARLRKITLPDLIGQLHLNT